MCRNGFTYSALLFSLCNVLTEGYRVRFNFRGVKLSRIADFRDFRVFIFAVAGLWSGSQVGALSAKGR